MFETLGRVSHRGYLLKGLKGDCVNFKVYSEKVA